MAGMRIGFAIGNPVLIKALNDVKYSYNSYTMNLTAIQAGVEAVKDKAYFTECVRKVVTTRAKTEERLKELGFSFPASGANFIFATHAKIPAKLLFEALRDADIYVRYFNLPRINNYLRISIGTEEEMNKVYLFLKKYISEYTKF
jgi:histidinol-phosphate aminotransferase